MSMRLSIYIIIIPWKEKTIEGFLSTSTEEITLILATYWLAI